MNFSDAAKAVPANQSDPTCPTFLAGVKKFTRGEMTVQEAGDWIIAERVNCQCVRCVKERQAKGAHS